MAGQSLGQQPWAFNTKGIRWIGNYMANLPQVDDFVRKNPEKCQEFDQGELFNALMQLPELNQAPHFQSQQQNNRKVLEAPGQA